MFKPFSLLFFIAVFAWIIRIFLTTDGSERIERTCSPVEILGKVAVSGTALVADQFTGNVQTVMNKWVYGCRYMVWRSVYEDEYLQYLQQVESQQATTPANGKETLKASSASGSGHPGRGEEKSQTTSQQQKL